MTNQPTALHDVPHHLPTPRTHRPIRREDRRIYNEVHEAALRVEGSVALGAHAMHSVLRLDAHRQSLSQGDPVTSALLSEIEAAAIQQVKAIQANLFNVWNV